MPTVQVEAHLSEERLLQAVRQLDARELERFTRQVLVLRAGRQA